MRLDPLLDSRLLKTRDSYIKILRAMGLMRVSDLLTYFPRAHRAENEFLKIAELPADQVVTVEGRLRGVVHLTSKKGMRMTRGILEDETGILELVFFNQPFLKQRLFKGMELVVTGKVKDNFGKKSMASPRFEPKSSVMLHTGRLVPVYRETEGMNSAWLRQKIHFLLPFADHMEDSLPETVRGEEGLMPFAEAIRQIHYPDSEELLGQARERLAFDELFQLQLKSIQKRKEQKKRAPDEFFQVEFGGLEPFLQALPFQLTGAQERAIAEIQTDLDSGDLMSRLVQGDVGSGKTAVAASAIYRMGVCRLQSAILAPTEILARQHYLTLMRLLQPLGLSIELLLGSTPASQKDEIKVRLAAGMTDLVVGTHALLEENVQFHRLGLAVIDEQHRFGVLQREALAQKGTPHLLSLSATPIPRTMALLLYGDQDLTILDEMPAGRKPVITRIVPELKRRDAYFWIADQVDKGRQAFVICPLITESEVIEVKAATEEFERLSKEIFPTLKLALLHGKMKSSEKEEIMAAFKANEISILVSTSVVEVGIDVPNATIMLIEGADRFGLSQLHQFRGRVGRGDEQSYCFLFTDADTAVSMERLHAMEKINDGFELSELDLKLRGPGEVFGLRQSGVPDLKIASYMDLDLLKRARAAAERTLA